LSYTNITNTATAPADFAFDDATGVATLTVNNGATPQVIDFTIGAPGSFDGITQFAGDFSLNFDRDGSSVGQLSRSEVSADGTLYGIFSNGMRRPLFEIPVTVVDNPNGLVEVNGNAYMMTDASGSFSAQTAGTGAAGSLNGNALEASNVDIVEEMTDLIKAQRAFSSNAKVITTTDELMDEITRLKR
jgi:flagellar hook protein FlgE